MKILAIDQARNGAWAVADSQTGEVIGYGTFSFDVKKYTYAKTILHIEEIVSTLIDAYDIEYVAIEDIQLRANAQSFKKLAQLQGVLVNLCEKNKLLYGIIAPTRWQNYCRARSRSSKEIAQKIREIDPTQKETKVLSVQFAREQYGIDTENDNLADALCILFYAMNALDINADC